MGTPNRHRRRVLRSLGASVIALAAPLGCAREPELSGGLADRGLPLTPQAGARFPAVVDTATRLDADSVSFLKARGVETVFRYYGHEPPSLPGKHLERAERDLLFDADLSVGVVFQHYNNCFHTFANAWGPEDAAEALRRAESLDQPSGSAIYFGVDGDWPYANMQADILRYFEAVAVALRDSGWRVGAYGDGCTLRLLRDHGLAELFWLSGSTEHTGTRAFYNQGGWTLYQNALDVGIGHGAVDGGLRVDTDLINPAVAGDIGHFSRTGAAATSADLTAALFAARAFARDDIPLRRAPAADAPVSGRIAKHGNLRVIARNEDWAEVLGREGGATRRSQPPRGFAPTALLATMTAFAEGGEAYGLCGSSIAPNPLFRERGCGGARFRDR